MHALELSRTASFPAAIQLIDTIETAQGTTFASKTLRAGIYLDQNRIDEAEVLCDQLISNYALKIEPYILKALIQRLHGNPERALTLLKSAVYIDQSCWISLYYSAEILKELHENSMAARYYQRVIESLQHPVMSECLLILAVNSKTEKQIIRSCTYKIQQLGG